MITKVISGGQTGVDQIGLRVAKKLGIPTGGTAPKHYRTEDGSNWSLEEFGLVEHESSDYEPRTIQNVLDSDGTILLGDPFSPGSKKTVRAARNCKPVTINPSKEYFRTWLEENNIQVLNVAGNRASKLSQRQMLEFEAFLTEVLSD